MEKYILQLLTDILCARENVSFPRGEKEVNWWDWISEEEEDRTALVLSLEEWTGISKDQLPPVELLSDSQVKLLLDALKRMLNDYHWSFMVHSGIPERIQYAALRDNFDQDAKVMQWQMGLFDLCRPGTVHGKCSLGEYCECTFCEDLLQDFTNLTWDEERASQLEIEIQHLKRKYGRDWITYYPYHLDKNYDDEDGNHDHGFDDLDDDEDDDGWWRH
jgi:hypothetical protein